MPTNSRKNTIKCPNLLKRNMHINGKRSETFKEIFSLDFQNYKSLQFNVVALGSSIDEGTKKTNENLARQKFIAFGICHRCREANGMQKTVVMDGTIHGNCRCE
jgi:hypothetical protein